MSTTKTESRVHAGEFPAWLELAWRQVGLLRYGLVEIVVHDSQVTNCKNRTGEIGQAAAHNQKAKRKQVNKTKRC